MKSTSWLVFALILSVRLSKAHAQSTAVAKTNSNFQYEQGHPDNLNTGQKCTQESAKTFSEPGVCQGAFPHDLFIWAGCGCLLSPAGLRRHRTDRKVKSLVKSRSFSQLLVYSGYFLSGMLANICSFVFFFIFVYPGRVCWEHIPFLSLDWNSCSRKCASKLPKRL